MIRYLNHVRKITQRKEKIYLKIRYKIDYINRLNNIMKIKTEMLKYVIQYLSQHCKYYLEVLDVRLPDIDTIPSITFTALLGLKG